MNEKLYPLLQKRIANTSIGPSTARRMGPKGTIQAARNFLMKLDLNQFLKEDEKAFQIVLDNITLKLQQFLPEGGRHWGSSRKFLNIFLRGVLYNRYLSERYNFDILKPWLEVPLDKAVAKEGLRKREKGAAVLPKWNGVIHLNPDESKKFQEFAQQIADSKGMARVHLDLCYWRN